ncbi:MAG: AbrB/MazE/SpoVT family DNA-binding domain-containing protein [Candidatus Methanodesulfokora sp.]|jgi:AbrB family looped-hinge helix DNA binding protein
MWRSRLSSKGQIVIPAEIRTFLGLKKGSLLLIKLEGRKIIIEPAEDLSSDVLIEAEEEIIERALAEAKESSDKAAQLLRDLGVES